MTKRRADYCPYCGSGLETRVSEGRDRRFCPDCGEFVYQNPVPTGAVAVLDGDAVLLIERAPREDDPDAGKWAVPGGILEVDEPARVGAARELREEAGLTVDPAALTLVRTGFEMDDPADGSVLSVTFAVERDRTRGTVDPGPEATAARFWEPAELLAGDEEARPIDLRRIEAAFERLRDEPWSPP